MPPRDALYFAIGSTSLNFAAANGENEAVARRIRDAFAGSLVSFSERLVTGLQRQFASRGIQASIENYATADPNLSMRLSYATATVEQVLECTPIYLFDRTRYVAVGVLARQVDVRSNATFSTLFGFGFSSPFGTGATSMKKLGPALATEQAWYPTPAGDIQQTVGQILALIPRFSEGIAEHYLAVG